MIRVSNLSQNVSSLFEDNNMKTEFPQSEKFSWSEMHNPLPRLGLTANVLMCFVNLPETEPPR